MKKQRGFTLVELIIVIAVIGVLAAILIPVFANVIDKANAKSALSDATNAVLSIIVEDEENIITGNYPDDMIIIVEKSGHFYGYKYKSEDGSLEIEEETGNRLGADSLDDAKTEMGISATEPEMNYEQLPSNVHVYANTGAAPEPTPTPTIEPTPEPTLEPTPEPTLEPTPEPVEAETYVYYYGNTYRNTSNNNLEYKTNAPTGSGYVPMSIAKEGTTQLAVNEEFSMQYTLQNGTSITRTFKVTANSYKIGTTAYSKCTETTNWPSLGISGAVFVEKTAGNKVAGSLALEVLKSSNNDNYLGTSKTIILVEDVDLTEEWLPIAFNGMLSGSFDGMGYAVNNVTINSPSISSVYGVGFIANVGATGSVVNLMLPNADIVHNNTNSLQFYVGIAVGKNAGTVKNVHTGGTAKFQNSEKGLGGVVGHMMNNGTISDCSSAATLINNRTATGGILGRADAGTITIRDCNFYGTINGTDSIGGILGYKYTSATVNITNCTCGSYPLQP